MTPSLDCSGLRSLLEWTQRRDAVFCVSGQGPGDLVSLPGPRAAATGNVAVPRLRVTLLTGSFSVLPVLVCEADDSAWGCDGHACSAHGDKLSW